MRYLQTCSQPKPKLLKLSSIRVTVTPPPPMVVGSAVSLKAVLTCQSVPNIAASAEPNLTGASAAATVACNAKTAGVAPAWTAIPANLGRLSSKSGEAVNYTPGAPGIVAFIATANGITSPSFPGLVKPKLKKLIGLSIAQPPPVNVGKSVTITAILNPPDAAADIGWSADRLCPGTIKGSALNTAIFTAGPNAGKCTISAKDALSKIPPASVTVKFSKGQQRKCDLKKSDERCERGHHGLRLRV